MQSVFALLFLVLFAAGEAAAEIGGHPQGGAIDGAVDGLHQVEVADVVRALAAECVTAAVVFGDSGPENARDVPVLHRGRQLRGFEHLVAGEQVP